MGDIRRPRLSSDGIRDLREMLTTYQVFETMDPNRLHYGC